MVHIIYNRLEWYNNEHTLMWCIFAICGRVALWNESGLCSESRNVVWLQVFVLLEFGEKVGCWTRSTRNGKLNGKTESEKIIINMRDRPHLTTTTWTFCLVQKGLYWNQSMFVFTIDDNDKIMHYHCCQCNPFLMAWKMLPSADGSLQKFK